MDYRNSVYNGFKHSFQKLIVLFISFCLAVFPAISLAASTPEDIWLKTITKNVDSLGRTTSVTVDAAKRTIIDGSARDTASKLLDYKPARSAVSGVMKKRLAQAAVGGGVVIIGAALVDGLLKGIGWIMEDGVYVKVKPSLLEENPTYIPYVYKNENLKGDVTYFSVDADGNSLCQSALSKDTGYDPWFYDKAVLQSKSESTVSCYFSSTKTSFSGSHTLTRVVNPNYIPNSPPKPNPTTKTPITQDELEKIMFGDYEGDPDHNIAPKNDGVWEGVEETMTADPNAGEGTKDKPENPVSKDVDQKLDANPNKTNKDHKSTDSKGDEETTKEDGTKEQTKTDTKTELPAFCNYAASLCKWMDWTQEEPTDKEEDFDIDKEELEIPAIVNTNRVQFGNQCPPAMSGSYSLLGRSHSFSYSFDALCTVAVNLKPAVIGCSSIAAAYIMLGISRKGDE